MFVYGVKGGGKEQITRGKMWTRPHTAVTAFHRRERADQFPYTHHTPSEPDAGYLVICSMNNLPTVNCLEHCLLQWGRQGRFCLPKKHVTLAQLSRG